MASIDGSLTLEDLGIKINQIDTLSLVDKSDNGSALIEKNGMAYRLPLDQLLGIEYIDKFNEIVDKLNNLTTDVANKESSKIILRVQNGEIQWKYETDSVWKVLIHRDQLAGPTGKSAYDIAVENGYVGSEEAFANLFLRTSITSDNITYYSTPLTTIINQLMYKSEIEVTTNIGKEYGDASPATVTWETGATLESQMITYSIYDSYYTTAIQESVAIEPSARSYTINIEDGISPVKIVVTISAIVANTRNKIERQVELFYGYRLYYVACKESEIDGQDTRQIMANIINHEDTNSILITGFVNQEIQVNANDEYDYIYILAPNMYGKLGCSIDGWINIFQVIDDSEQIRNDYNKYATYTIYRSAHCNLGRTTINLVSV